MEIADNIQNKQLAVLAQMCFNLPVEGKSEFISLIYMSNDQNSDYPDSLSTLGISRFLQDQKYEDSRQNTCHFCGGKHVVRNGTKSDLQRYICLPVEKPSVIQ